MEQTGISRPSAVRIRPTVVLAAALMVIWILAYWQLSPLSSELFQLSPAGPRALLLYVTGQYLDAARAYRTGLQRRGPLPPYTYDPAGYRAFRAGRFEEAERRAMTTLSLVPSAIEPQLTLAELALERGDVPAAAGTLAAVLRRSPDHVDALYLGAVAIARFGDPGSAVERLNRALRVGFGERDTVLFAVMELTGELQQRPPERQPLCLLAHLHRYLRIFDERQGLTAMSYARQAILAGDRPADAYLTLGIVHDKRREYEAARRAMRQAIAVDPRHAEALRWLAVEADKLGDRLVQYQMITRAFEAAPTDPFYLRDLEHAMVNRLGDPLGMARLMERAIAIDAGNAEAHAYLAKALVLVGDHPRARQHAQRAASLRAGRGERS